MQFIFNPDISKKVYFIVHKNEKHFDVKRIFINAIESFFNVILSIKKFIKKLFIKK